MPGDRIADEVLAYASETNVTQIVVGKSARSRWFELLHGSVVRELVDKADGIAVHVLAGGDETLPPKRVRTGGRERAARPLALRHGRADGGRGLGLAFSVDRAIDLANESLIFVAPIIVSAIRDGFGPSLLAALLSTLVYNFFFLEPFYTLTIENPSNVVAFLFFGVISIVTSSLAARARTQMVAARHPGPDHGRALRLQPQAHRPRRLRRAALGHGPPDRHHAPGRGGDPPPR